MRKLFTILAICGSLAVAAQENCDTMFICANNSSMSVPIERIDSIIFETVPSSVAIDQLPQKMSELEQKIEMLEKHVQQSQILNKPFDKNNYKQAYIDNMSMTWNPVPHKGSVTCASYNILEALTDKVQSMTCKAVWQPSDERGFTTIALISNPNGVHNVKGYYPELNNKVSTHINKKSIHPTFTRSSCSFGIMLDGVLSIKHKITYDKALVADGVTEYSFGWSVDEEGVTVYTPDGKSHRFLNADDGVNYLDYCGKYCCFEFFNNESGKGAQPLMKYVEVVQSDGFIIYDNFLRPNGLLGQTPAGFVWHLQSTMEGYYSYQ